jgi:hypothetical protein
MDALEPRMDVVGEPRQEGRQILTPLLTPQVRALINSEIAATPAHLLPRVLSRHLPPEEPEEEEEDSTQEPTRETPVNWEGEEEDEDEDEDEEGEFSFLSVTEEDLWEYPPRTDVIVTVVNDQIKVYSGLSDLLIRIKTHDAVGREYKEALCRRITVTMAIAQLIAEKNTEYFQNPSVGINCLTPEEVLNLENLNSLLQGLKEPKEYISRLVNTCWFRLPNGKQKPMRAFFKRAPSRSPQEIVTKEKVLEVLRQEPLNRPYSDKRIVEEILNKLSGWLKQRWERNKNSLRVSVCNIRKSLNIPNSQQRAKLYKEVLRVLEQEDLQKPYTDEDIVEKVLCGLSPLKAQWQKSKESLRILLRNINLRRFQHIQLQVEVMHDETKGSAS